MLPADSSLVEENLRTAMQFFGHASGCGAICERDGMILIDSGVDYAVFNIALLNGPVDSMAELERRIAAAGRWYASRKTRWSQWICDHHVPLPSRWHVPGIFERNHLRPLTEAPGMIAPNLRPPERALPQLEWRRVDDPQTRLEFAHLTTISFDIPFATARLIYQPESAWRGAYEGYVGYAGGRAVCTAAAVVAAGCIGFYSVSTLPDQRRRGYAEALMRKVFDEVRRRTGIQQTVLQATRAGYSMYKKMGYQEATRFSVYIS